MLALSKALSLVTALLAIHGAQGGYSNVGFTTCNERNNNVMSGDITNKIYGSLRAGDMEWRLDDFCLPHWECTNRIKIGVQHKLSLSVTDEGLARGVYFRGFLVRLSGPPGLDVTSLMTVNPGDPFVQESPICLADGVAGLTHKEDSKKTEISVKFMINEPFDYLIFDVTAVVELDPVADISKYYFDRMEACTSNTTFAQPGTGTSSTAPTTLAPVAPVGGVGGASGSPPPTSPAPVAEPIPTQGGVGGGSGSPPPTSGGVGGGSGSPPPTSGGVGGASGSPPPTSGGVDGASGPPTVSGERPTVPTTVAPVGGGLGVGAPVTSAPVPPTPAPVLTTPFPVFDNDPGEVGGLEVDSPTCSPNAGKGKGKGDVLDDPDCPDGKGKGKAGKGDVGRKRGRRALRRPSSSANGYW